jgi:hypothetical protein
MLANFFGKSNPVNFIVVFLIFLGFYIANFFNVNLVQFVDINVILNQLLTIILFLFLFLFYNFILIKNKLTLNNSYGLLLFALFSGFFPPVFSNVTTIFLNLLLLIFLRRVFSLRSNKDVYKKIFDCGFWLGILFLLDSTTVIFGVLIFLSVGMFQKLTVRTLLIPVVGFVTPVFCYFSYCLWEGDTSEFSNLFLWYSNYNFEVYTANKFLFSTLFLGIGSLISIVIKTPKVFLISGDYRKYWILIIFNFFFAITVFLIQNTHQTNKVLLLFFPASVIITNWLESIERGFVKNIFIIVLIATPVILFIV